MAFRNCLIISGLYVLLSVPCAPGDKAQAQQDNSNQAQPMMSPNIPKGALNTQGTFTQRLNLNRFEAAVGDISVCSGNEECISEATGIKELQCAADACDGSDKTKGPISCFPGFFDKFTVQAKEQVSQALCSWAQSPSSEKLQAIMSQMPDAKQEDAVEEEAYYWALKGSADKCQDTVKKYVGDYGSNWNLKWYRDLSGCRILARQSTRQQEEKDFNTWIGTVQGAGKCSDIVNTELKNACEAPGATSPVSAAYEEW